MSGRCPLAHVVLAVVMVSALYAASGCVHLYGEAPNSVAVHDNSTHWDYAFQGLDWVGVDAKNNTWPCTTGLLQSPLNLPSPTTVTKLSSHLQVKFEYPPLANATASIAKVINNGHTIQTQPLTASFVGGVTIPTLGHLATDLLRPKAQSTPALSLHQVFIPAIQFHFHTSSEHEWDGTSGAMELHIVHNSLAKIGLADCPPTGCYVVVGVNMLVKGDYDNEYLASVFDAAPTLEGNVTRLPLGTVLDFDKILPAGKAYMTYQGSFTSPPCTEGLLWVVMQKPIYISRRQYVQFKNAVGMVTCADDNTVLAGKKPTCSLAAWDDNRRITQHSNNRPIFYA